MPRRPVPFVAGLCALVALPAAAPAVRPDSTSIGVAEREFRIGVYRRVVPPGTVRFNIRNFGEDVHNVAVFTVRGSRLGQSVDVAAGHRATLALRLRRPGSYRLVCTTADHARRGMRARITVVRGS